MGSCSAFTSSCRGELRAARARWLPDGRSLAFTAPDGSGALAIFVQAFSPGQDTLGTRRALARLDNSAALETFGISPDGTRLVYSVVDQIDSLMLAEGLPGIEPPRRR